MWTARGPVASTLKPAYRSLQIVQAVAGRPEGWAPIKGHAPDQALGHRATIAGVAVRGGRRVMPVHPLRRMAANLSLACGNCGNCGNLLPPRGLRSLRSLRSQPLN